MSLKLLLELNPLSSINIRTSILDELKTNYLQRFKEIHPQIAFDLGMLFLYNHLEKQTEKEALVDFWKSHSPVITVNLAIGEYQYRPYIDFIILDSIMAGNFIDLLLEKITPFSNLSFKESCSILYDLERFYIVPLSETDINLIKVIRKKLIDNVDFTNKFLANQVGVRSNYVSRRLSYLRSNAYFRITGTVDFPRIGLYQYIILLNSNPSFESKIPDFFSSPFTRSIRKFPNQKYDYIISCTLPEVGKNRLEKYLQEMKERGYIRFYYYVEVVSIADNLCFNYYSYKKRPTINNQKKPGFFIDWFNERIHMSGDSIDTTKTSRENPFHHFSFTNDRVFLSRKALKLLTIYRSDMQVSVRQLSQELSMAWEETNQYLEQIKPLLFPMILLYYTGLNQTVILFIEEIKDQELNALEVALSHMPQVFSYRLKDQSALITINLMNGAHRLNDLLCECLPDLTKVHFLLGSKAGGIFRHLPYQYYDENQKKWTLPKNSFTFV
jgi:hypothetical protein